MLTGNIDGADYKIEVPPNWNGTLLLFSHGAVRPGFPNPALDAPPMAGAGGAAYLLDKGYALAGSSFSRTGWAVADAQREDIALLDYFASAVGKPKRTIAWGTSLGGSITAQLAQNYPERFDGVLPVSGTLAGGGAWFNPIVDAPFVIKTLLPGGSDLSIVDIPDPDAAVAQFQQVVADAQEMAVGRARLALAAAVGDLPSWNDPASAPPAPDDYEAQELNQFKWLNASTSLIYQRWNLEQHAAGNISSNVGVDYRQQLERSPSRDEVYALYEMAGLDLDADLHAMASAPRVYADPGLMSYPDPSIPLNGRLKIPVLTLHTTGDGLVPVQAEVAYANTVRAAGQSRFLRQLFVNRAGHVTLTPAELITALSVLVHRLDTGSWQDEDSAGLSAAASMLGPDLNTLIWGVPQPIPMQPAFVDFLPAPSLRLWDARCISGGPVAIITGELGPICK